MLNRSKALDCLNEFDNIQVAQEHLSSLVKQEVSPCFRSLFQRLFTYETEALNEVP